MSVYGMAQPTSEVTLPKSSFRMTLLPWGLLELIGSITSVSGDGSRSGVSDGWEEEAQQCFVGEFAGWAGSGGQRTDLLSKRTHTCGPAHMCAFITDARDRGQNLSLFPKLSKAAGVKYLPEVCVCDRDWKRLWKRNFLQVRNGLKWLWSRRSRWRCSRAAWRCRRSLTSTRVHIRDCSTDALPSQNAPLRLKRWNTL